MMNRLSLLLVCLFLSVLQAEERLLHAAVTFAGTSTLHDFEGLGQAQPHPAEWTPRGEGGVLSASGIPLKVSKLSTDHAKRDRNMMKMFEPEDYPLITADLREWTLGDPAAGPQELTLHVHGVEVAVPVTLDAFTVENGVIRFRCSFSLSLKECDLKRPSVLDLIRVGDEVKVSVESELVLPDEG
jgi:hypothetical protein